MPYVFNEPREYGFTNLKGHSGKFFGTDSPRSQHLIIECEDKLTVALTQQETEFNYLVLEGSGYFIIEGTRHSVGVGDLVVIPPGTQYTFGGKLKMFLLNTPKWSADQEIQHPLDSITPAE